ncbi:SHOCT domain-containing protein [Agromyces soli]
MFSGFSGWHAMIILAVVVIPLALIALVVWLIVRAARSSGAPASSMPTGAQSDASARLAELERLRAAGQISDEEYQSLRAQILGEL